MCGVFFVWVCVLWGLVAGVWGYDVVWGLVLWVFFLRLNGESVHKVFKNLGQN